MASPTLDHEPDWSGLRAASVAVGVREAARQASSHLPAEEQVRFVERVMKRCSREGWLVKAEESRTMRISQALPLSAPVRNGADTITATLAERHKQTRIGLAGYTAKMARQAEQSGCLEEAPLYKAVADIAGKVWPETQQTGQTGVVVNIAVLGRPPDQFQSQQEQFLSDSCTIEANPAEVTEPVTEE